jgi:carbamoyl-phosphate synthase large subunit
MRSTGEVMGHAARFGHAFAKSQLAAGNNLPLEGSVLISVNDFDKGAALKIARDLSRLGFQLHATHGTAEYFRRVGLAVQAVNKVSQGSPHVVDLIEACQVNLILNTPLGPITHSDGARIRNAAARTNVPLLTTLSAGAAAVAAIQALRQKELKYRSLQAHYNWPTRNAPPNATEPQPQPTDTSTRTPTATPTLTNTPTS